MMGPYNPVEPLAQIIEELEKGREFAREGGQKLSDAMLMSKVSPFYRKHGFSTTTYDSGDNNPPTSRHGQNKNCSFTERTERRKDW